jgi:DNA-binding MarR family transcriptional regulator
MSTATGIIDRLVKKGLLVRGSHAKDRRVVTVALADDGKVLVEKLNSHFNTLIDKVRNIVTEEEFEFILTMVQKVMFGLQKNESESNTKPVQSSRNISIE